MRLSKLLLTLCVIWTHLCSSAEPLLQSNQSPSLEHPKIISGEFTLRSHLDQTVSKSSFDGFYRLVFFGYTQCPDVCPTTMARIGQVMHQLGDDSERVKVLFISVDPQNDTLERLASYVSAFHPSIIGLRGTNQQIKAAAQGFNVTYGQSLNTKDLSAGSVYHSAYLFLMDEQGDLLDVFGYGASVERITESIVATLSKQPAR